MTQTRDTNPTEFSANAVFAGVRVADFSWVGVGPMAAQNLAFYGAEVIRVESEHRPDTFRSGGPFREGTTGYDRSAYWANYNRNKKGMTINLANPAGRRVARELIAVSDVVTESFTPGAMQRLGLDYDACRLIRPDVVMISMSLAGQDGPWAAYRGFGLILQAQAGFTHLTGWPDRPPAGTGVAYTDWVATHFAATALIAALDHRRRTGEGQYIDLSQLESSVYGLDAAVVDALVNGALAKDTGAARIGNRHQWAAPHGVYPCALEADPPAGSEATRWCAITVFDDGQWQALCRALPEAGLDAEPAFRTLLGRRDNETLMNERIGSATAVIPVHELERRMRAVGVPCSRVATVADVEEDEQLRHRGHFAFSDHPIIGRLDYDAPAYRLSAAPLSPDRRAPLMGEHNAELCGGLLGYDADALATLVAEEALE